jgi:hypothetical protein
MPAVCGDGGAAPGHVGYTAQPGLAVVGPPVRGLVGRRQSLLNPRRRMLASLRRSFGPSVGQKCAICVSDSATLDTQIVLCITSET